MGLTARREVLSPRLRLMVGGGSLGPRRGRLRANVSGSASILGRSLRVLSLLHLPWPHGASGRPSWAIERSYTAVHTKVNYHYSCTQLVTARMSRSNMFVMYMYIDVHVHVLS